MNEIEAIFEPFEPDDVKGDWPGPGSRARITRMTLSDGKGFVSDVEEALRIRTGESGLDAVWPGKPPFEASPPNQAARMRFSPCSRLSTSAFRIRATASGASTFCPSRSRT